MSRLGRLFRRRREERVEVRRDVDDEIDFHLAMRAERLRRDGMPSEEAGPRARERFGDVEVIRARLVRSGSRELRWRRATRLVEDALQDARFAVRSLLRTKGFAVTVMITLALGIGANTLIYSVIRGVLLRPVGGVAESASVFEFTGGVSYPAWRDIAEALPGLPVAALSERKVAVGLGTDADRVTGAFVSGGFFEVMGVRAVQGRTLRVDDDVPGTAPVVVLGHDYWRSAAGGDPAVIGSSIHVNGVAVTVVGVAAADFRGVHLGVEPVVWLPIGAWPAVAPAGPARLEERGWDWLMLYGRQPAGSTLAQTAQRLRPAIAAAYEDMGEDDLVAMSRPRPLQTAAVASRARGGVVRFIAVLAGVVVLVLVAACANIAGLLLARASHREREIGVRVALGAGRARLIRQLVTESIVLAGTGGFAGMVLFLVARSVVARVTLPGGVAGASLDLGVDAGLAGFVLVVSLATGVLVGLAPALQSSRADMVSALKGAGFRRGSHQQWLRGGLVTAQVAIAVVLLFGMGLFARALGRALAIDPGFDPAPLAALAVDPALARVDGAERFAYFGIVTERAAAVAGVAAVSWTTSLPLTSDFDRQTADIPGYVPGPDERVRFEYASVGPGFHEMMGIPLIAGRGFEERDGRDAAPVAIINETAARRYFAGRDPVGATFVMGGTDIRIIGVARDIRYHELTEDPRPYAWFPVLQTAVRGGGSSPILVLRASQDVDRALRDVVDAVRAADARVPVFASVTLDDHLRGRLAPQLAGAWLLGVFGVLGLVVAGVGIYGIIAYVVSMRAREIGLRMALGARFGDVLRIVATQNLAFAAAGVPLGLALALVLARGLDGFLFGMPAHDPVTIAGSIAIMAAIALLASAVPVRRAARIDPLVALRSDG